MPKRYNKELIWYDLYKCERNVYIPESCFGISKDTDIIIVTEYLNFFQRLYAKIMCYVAFQPALEFEVDNPKEHYWMKRSTLYGAFRMTRKAIPHVKPQNWFQRLWNRLTDKEIIIGEYEDETVSKN